MVATLTEKVVKNAQPKVSPYEIADRGGKESVRELRLRIQPSGTKTFYVQIARGRREKIGSASAYTLAKARAKAKRILGKAAEGHDFRAERHRNKILKDTTLRSYVDGPYRDHAEEMIADAEGMLSRIARVFEHVLDKPMNEITELDMARWRKKRAGVTVSTQRRELANLKAVLNHAVANKVIPSHQLNQYRVTARAGEDDSSPVVRFLSQQEEQRLRDALDDREKRLRAERSSANAWREARGYDLLPELPTYADHLKPLVLLALNTGLRRGDLFGLKWSHVDLQRRQIRKVIEKTSHSRRKAGKAATTVTLPLSREAVDILSALASDQAASSYVFASPKTGGRLGNIRKSWTALMVDARIENFRFHDLRHTFASRLVMAGVDINAVRELLCHSDIKVTLIYSHLSPDHKAAALERAFGGAQ